MSSPEDKIKRAKRRADKRRKNERDALRRLHKSVKNKRNKEDFNDEEFDGDIS